MMRIVLAGAGGYGSLYCTELLSRHQKDLIFAGVVEKYPDRIEKLAEIREKKIPVYESLEDFYNEQQADLAVISTPPFLHLEQSRTALQNGSYVLCEKPAAPTVPEAVEMAETAKACGKWIAIGYQWSYSEAIRSLKADILAGKLGRPLDFKTFISWPRNFAYYARGGGWGGRIQKDGRLVLDSIASNACAHYLHNMFFLLGDSMDRAARPVSAEAECYRVNAIENFDTCLFRINMKDGTKLFYAATHASERVSNPEFVYTFEKAVVSYAQDEGGCITARFSDGRVKDYGNPFADDLRKLRDCMACVENQSSPVCTAETAVEHTRFINSLYEQGAEQIVDFPAEIRDVRDDAVYAKGLFEKLREGYEKEALLSELGCSSAKPVLLTRF